MKYLTLHDSVFEKWRFVFGITVFWIELRDYTFMVWFVFCRHQIFQRKWKSSRTIWSTHTKSQMRLYVLRTYGVPTMRICLTLRVSMTFDIWFTIDTVWKLDPNQWFSVTNKTRLFLFVCHFLEGGRCIDFGFYSPLPLSPRLIIFWCYSRLYP